MADFPLLKDMIDRQLAVQIADRIAIVHPAFEHAGFVTAVTAELDSLELKQRFNWIADKLREYLPDDYPTALKILLQILDDAGGRFEPIEDAGFRLLPIPTFVYRHGLEHLDASLDAMVVITRHTSCEAAIRPFIIHHQQATLARLHKWALDDNEHVRRLVSEGSRPRLPWWPQLTDFIADPTPALALLERLKDDPSLYVRRSVANHLNDIGKDHPELLLARMEAWSRDASEERLWLINHALRTLVKRGDRRALAILGYGPAAVELADLRLAPAILQYGNEIEFGFSLRNVGAGAQNLMIDFLIHFVKANGTTAPKVFKLKKMRLPAGDTASISKRFAIRPISTRKYYPGRHRLEIQVNGRVLGGADFELAMD
ncbi:MAG: DNA alkylation repair protein [Chloroflexota bacterium]|nr:DNA alkylation repair protein [Chloroflexota bacterium]MDE2946112.1 DNA alkylation repair protein [Chloroflexota bacterium]